MLALVVGGRGLLGPALYKGLRGNFGTYACKTVRSDPGTDYRLDLSETFVNLPQPTTGDWNVVYLVAAVTGIMACEAEAQRTWRINADAPVNLALQCKARGIFPVFISSDAVEKAPRLNYAMQKAYVESFVLGYCEGAVVRPSRIPHESPGALVELLIRIGKTQTRGLYRWQP